MATDHDIPIKYVNATKKVDFQVVVFTKNYNTDTPKIYYVAWQVLAAQSSAQFKYPAEISIGATYQKSGQIITAGPFPAQLGSTWKITQSTENDTATLTNGMHKTISYNFCKFWFQYTRLSMRKLTCQCIAIASTPAYALLATSIHRKKNL